MPKLRDQAGVTYATVIFMVMTIGIMLAMTGQSWKRLMQREREEELMFRGMQVFDAISTWHRSRGGHPPTPLRELKDLLKDPRSLQNVRYLRRLYTDPITGKEFEVVKGTGGGIIGVKSPSEAKPLKMANFPTALKHFEEKKSYSEWLFVPGKFRSQIVPPIGSVPLTGSQQPTIIQGGTGQPQSGSPGSPVSPKSPAAPGW